MLRRLTGGLLLLTVFGFCAAPPAAAQRGYGAPEADTLSLALDAGSSARMLRSQEQWRGRLGRSYMLSPWTGWERSTAAYVGWSVEEPLRPRAALGQARSYRRAAAGTVLFASSPFSGSTSAAAPASLAPVPAELAEPLEALQAYPRAARAQGWILSDSVAADLEAWLGRVEGALRKGEDARARTSLNGLLLALRERYHPALTTEAYDRLRWDAAALRDRLPAPEEGYGLLPLPLLRDVVVRAVVKHDFEQDYYYYEYSIENGAASDGSVSAVEIDLARDTAGTTPYFLEGLQFKDPYTQGRFESAYDSLKGQVVPVGFLSFPQFWAADLTERGTALFGGSLIRPGQVQDGFVLMAEALPGFRDFRIEPRYRPRDHYPPSGALHDEEFEQVDALVHMDREQRLPIRGKTIGPVALPADFDAYVWIDKLQGYTREAYRQGWLGDAEVQDELLRSYERVRFLLKEQDLRTLRRALHDLLAHIEVERYSSLNPEGYALLRYNTEYLFEQVF